MVQQRKVIDGASSADPSASAPASSARPEVDLDKVDFADRELFGAMHSTRRPLTLREKLWFVALAPLGTLRLMLFILEALLWILAAEIAIRVPVLLPSLLSLSVASNRLMLWICGFKVTVKGEENLERARETARKENRPLVVVANHISLLDSHAICVGIRERYTTLVKSHVLKTPLYGTIVRALGFLEVKSSSSGVFDRMSSYVNEGGSEATPLLVFPEGTVTNGSALLPFRSGVFVLKKEVVPIALKYVIPGGASVHLNQPRWWLDLINAFYFICQPSKEIVMNILPPMAAPASGDAKEFSEKTCKAMSMNLNVPMTKPLDPALVNAFWLNNRRRYARGQPIL